MNCVVLLNCGLSLSFFNTEYHINDKSWMLQCGQMFDVTILLNNAECYSIARSWTFISKSWVLHIIV